MYIELCDMRGQVVDKKQTLTDERDLHPWQVLSSFEVDYLKDLATMLTAEIDLPIPYFFNFEVKMYEYKFKVIFNGGLSEFNYRTLAYIELNSEEVINWVAEVLRKIVVQKCAKEEF